MNNESLRALVALYGNIEENKEKAAETAQKLFSSPSIIGELNKERDMIVLENPRMVSKTLMVGGVPFVFDATGRCRVKQEDLQAVIALIKHKPGFKLVSPGRSNVNAHLIIEQLPSEEAEKQEEVKVVEEVKEVLKEEAKKKKSTSKRAKAKTKRSSRKPKKSEE